MTGPNSDLNIRVLSAGLSVSSGVYAAIDDSIDVRMGPRGEYEYVWLSESCGERTDDLLKVSAFGGAGLREDEIAAQLFGNLPGAILDPVAGHYLELFAGWATEPNIRENSSSGGLTTWILLELLRSERIDGVIHMKPGVLGEPLFSYQVSRTADEILNGAKTRYFPGELSRAFNEIKSDGGRYALVAIPSIAYEVRLLQHHDPTFKEQIPFIIGLICGHQKTANYASSLAWQAGATPGTVSHIDFRKKIPGKPANSYSTEITGVFGGIDKTVVVPQSALHGTDWGLGFFKSNFSDFTEDIFNETADIVLGDAWLPRYVKDSAGTNVAIVRNAEILKIVEAARSAGRIKAEPLELDDLLRSQKSLLRHNFEEISYRTRLLAKRGEFVPPLRRNANKRISPLRRRIQRLRLHSSRESHEAYLEALSMNDFSIFEKRMRPIRERYKRAQRWLYVNQQLKEDPFTFIASLFSRIRR